MKREGNTFQAESNKKLYIKKYNLLVDEYTIGTVLFPVNGELKEFTTTEDDIIECYIVNIDGIDYKVEADSYNKLVTGLIRIKYSLDDELALIANLRIKDVSKEEKEFQEWRDKCKKLAKDLINE